MLVDMMGGVFSDLSLAFKARFDVVAGVAYSLVVVRVEFCLGAVRRAYGPRGGRCFSCLTGSCCYVRSSLIQERRGSGSAKPLLKRVSSTKGVWTVR